MPGMDAEQPVSPSDTASTYLRNLITMLNPTPALTPAIDINTSWTANSQQGIMLNNTNSGETWSSPPLQNFGGPSPRQDFDLQWNFDIQ
jgi:hypothetical protein